MIQQPGPQGFVLVHCNLSMVTMQPNESSMWLPFLTTVVRKMQSNIGSSATLSGMHGEHQM